MANNILIVFLLIFSTGLLIESRIVDDLQTSDELDFDTKSKEAIDNLQQHFGSVFRRQKRSTSSQSSESDSSGRLTSAEAANLMKLFGTLAWEANKASFLSGIIEAFTDSDSNITIVGWEHVYNEQGEITDLHAIEFVIPPKPKSGDGAVAENDDDDEEDGFDFGSYSIDHSEINELREILEPITMINVDSAIFLTHYDEDKKSQDLLYLDTDELYIELDGYAIYNKTVYNATPGEIDHLINVAKSYPDSSILKWDAQGTLKKEQSIINSLNVVKMMDVDNANDTVILESPIIVANTILENKDEQIPKALVQKFNEKFPEYQWRVIVDASNYFLSKDCAISYEIDFFNFHDIPQEYYLYGLLKEASS